MDWLYCLEFGSEGKFEGTELEQGKLGEAGPHMFVGPGVGGPSVRFLAAGSGEDWKPGLVINCHQYLE